MKSYRRNYLPESDFRRTLLENPWVLPAWENEIVTLIDEIPRGGEEDEPEFRLLSDPHLTWEAGPEVWCRVCDLPDRLTAPRYLLHTPGVTSPGITAVAPARSKADRREVQIPLEEPRGRRYP